MTTLESMRLRERLVLHQDSPVQDGKGIAAALNKQASIRTGTLGKYSKNFKFGNRSVTISDLPCESTICPGQDKLGWSDYLPCCVLEKGTTRQTFDGKVAAVAFAHKVVRNVRINYHDPEFELVSKGYKRTQGQVDRKQPVTTQMLLAIRELLGEPDKQAEVMWGSVVLGFFFLDRSSELWDLSQLTVRQGQNDTEGRSDPKSLGGFRGDRIQLSQGDRMAQGVIISHYKTDNAALCPCWERVRAYRSERNG
ncbi:hypothetical protein GQ600_27932 [Phytophthora cactorum]|nr:hypothetical protein GQ600_27932 [Phytophthora cactorum]